MKIIDPAKEPNRWLAATLLDLLEQDTPESKETLAEGIQALSNWIEPGLVDQLFAHWIDRYNQLLVEHETQRSNSLPQYLQGDLLE
jgi:hypothetical protein